MDTHWVQDVWFSTIIEGYMLSDIKNMLALDRREKGNCASPLGLFVYSCMEQLGYLIAGSEYDPEECMAEKVRDYVWLTYGDAVDDSTTRDIVQAIMWGHRRLSFAPLGIPKEFGITRMPNHVLLGPHPECERVLNIEELAWIFIRSTGNLYKLLGNDEIRERVVRRLKMLQEG